jgi:hypothetical protein
MLTYNKVCNIDRDMFACCDKTPGDQTPGGDCCYDAWVKDLVQVTANWKQANADATNKEIEYNLTVEERDRLKAWYTDWEAADEKADALCRQLELFVLHLKKICLVTEKTNKAIEILFCMIEDLFIRVDKLKAGYDSLLQCINCLKRPELGPGIGIMKCIEDYGVKLTAVIQIRDVLISQIITVIELAYGMHINICKEYGLKEVIYYWKKKFNCDGSSYESYTETSNLPAKVEQNGYSKERCYLEPHISLPIDGDSYFTDLENDYKKVKQDVDLLKKDLDAAREKRDALLACKQSLEKAIEEVNPANKCK